MSADEIVGELFARCERDHLAWINGDGSYYGLPEDGTIMGALGGAFRGGPSTAERQLQGARQWGGGTGSVELIAGGAEGDVAWLVMTERGRVTFSDDPGGGEHRWDLRVTELFRRRAGEWERFHRHADPLVDVRPLRDAAALLRRPAR